MKSKGLIAIIFVIIILIDVIISMMIISNHSQKDSTKFEAESDSSLSNKIDADMGTDINVDTNLSNVEIVTETLTSMKDDSEDLIVNDNLKKEVYLDEMSIIESERYTGNEGDSFVYPIGTNQNTRGNICTNGKAYDHGIECWIARWNGEDEISWATATFKLDKKYLNLKGECRLIESYNINDFDTTLEFYSENGIISSYRLTPESIPFYINLDVMDCETLTISLYDNVAKSGGTSFGLVDMVLDSSTYDSLLSEYIEPKTTQHIANTCISDITASSHLSSQTYGNTTYDYSPKKAIDNNFETCWCEGKNDNGIGEYLTIIFDSTYEVNGLSIYNGLCTSSDLFYKNSRPHEITIILSNGDSYDFELNDSWENRNNIILFDSSIDTSSLTIRINSVYEGSKYKDTCISEISIF